MTRFRQFWKVARAYVLMVLIIGLYVWLFVIDWRVGLIFFILMMIEKLKNKNTNN